ncbi:MAG: DUF1365 domain-containing protein [Leptospiraceae bacterium]|nr:DUF1365 domain-containing protein [Leptospiraceae bacterium]
MVVNSSLFECKVIHNRLSPKKHAFSYGLFTFCIDLDEVEELDKKYIWFGNQKWNLFSFFPSDHFQYGDDSDFKNGIISYAKENGCAEEITKVILVTHLRILGYTFNPVCFYFLYNRENLPVCTLIEVHNTFGEMKPFVALNQNGDYRFYLKTTKHFYVSPFFELDTEFEFRLNPPSDKLKIHIDDYKDGEKVFLSTYIGNKKPLTNWNLIYYFLKYPLLTLKVISLIHWQAMLLYLKKIPFIKKIENPELQKGVYLGKNS